jgi:hypothetical protein
VRLGAAATFLLVLAACRIENRAPVESLRNDEEIRATVATYYQSGAARDWDRVRTLFWDSAAIQRGPSEGGTWRAFESPDAYGAWLEAGGGGVTFEPVRVEPRQYGDLATVWVTTRRPGEARGSATTDHFLLRRMGGAWRITALASATSTPPAAVR